MMSLQLVQAFRMSAVSVLVLTGPLLASDPSADTSIDYLYRTRYTANSLSAPRFRHAALRLGDGRVGIFDGIGANSDYVELFDPAMEQFTAIRATQWFGDFAGVALADGNALLVDGEHDSVFDYRSEQFVATRNTYTGGYIRFPVLVPLLDGRIFICGGWDIDFKPTDACGVFDPQTMRFEPLGPLVTPRVLHTAVLLDDGRVLIAGGYEGGSEPMALDSLEIFDTNTGRSARFPTTLHQARYSHCCLKLPDNRVLILGGTFSFADFWLHGTEIFDPNTAVVSKGPTLGLGRNNAQTAILPSGRTAVFGGNYDARAIEVYCPETGTFRLADSLMLEPRWSEFTATALDSGAVLIAGGHVNVGLETLQGAELFEEIEIEIPSRPDPTPEVAAEHELAGDTWCVEVWDANGVLSTVWLDGYDCPEQYNPGFPHRHFTTVLRATEGIDFTHLVVRFRRNAPYDARVRLFNVVGWTRVLKVILGVDLDASAQVQEG